MGQRETNLHLGLLEMPRTARAPLMIPSLCTQSVPAYSPFITCFFSLFFFPSGTGHTADQILFDCF